VAIDDETQLLTGSETITYHNNSPDVLTYLWVQLDQNVRAPGNLASQTASSGVRDSTAAKFFASRMGAFDYEGGFKIASVVDGDGNNLPYMIHRTMMRIDLPQPMKTGDTFTFSIDWSYNIYDRMMIDGRGGYEYFPADGNYAYTCAQWYPRMAVYDDYEGWQNKQFIGRGEFALTFGNFEVNITVPDDHIVAATGTLENPKDVLTKEQLKRLDKAKETFDKPVFIVTEAEARENEKEKSDKTATWQFKAEMVRDFAFASSRKYIWDAQAVKLPTSTPLAMSFYPKEGNPLWERESTKAIKNTLEVYSARTFDYPYPVAISVNAANQGMEYPMICFNYGRPDSDGNYSDRIKDGNISVIVHEVGHNYFPMIVNSDERQWTWMDEGLNTFLEKETKRERYPDLDLVWGTPKGVVSYMKGDKDYIRPIMTNSEQVMQFGYNAYGKPAAALTVLREVVMGPELFDAAFKEYANRWKFRHPKPGDFFRTMEDASAVDLDWF
ncbi:MAG: M1 family metallopeptidase, partial [Cyclobacteriaceae bacterium]